MSKKELCEKLKEAIIDLDDELVANLVSQAAQSGLTPMEVIIEGLNPGLAIIGELYEKKERFMSDLMVAGQIMSDAVEVLLPVGKVAAEGAGDIMIIGTVQGDLHTVGKKIVAAVFSGAGYRAIDLGEDVSAADFVKAAKEYKAKIVGASAIIGPSIPYCKVVHEALTKAGIRDDLIFITGGFSMTDEWCDEVGADAFGSNALDGLRKAQKLMVGEMPRWKDRVKK